MNSGTQNQSGSPSRGKSAFLAFWTVCVVLGSFFLGWPSGARLHAQTTQQEWEQEAVRRYPDLGIQGTPLNNAFVAEYQRLRNSPDNSGFFSNPSWPVLLAAQCQNQLAAGTADSESVPTPRVEKHKHSDSEDSTQQTDTEDSETDSTKQKSDHSTDTMEYVLIGSGVLCLLYVCAGISTSCPRCRRWWSKKAINSEIIGRENFTRTVTHYDRSYQAGHATDSQSHIITERKQIVPVERTHYRVTCKCKHCNHQWIEAAHSDSA